MIKIFTICVKHCLTCEKYRAAKKNILHKKYRAKSEIFCFLLGLVQSFTLNVCVSFCSADFKNILKANLIIFKNSDIQS